jgi:hypothetical protein
MRRRVVIDGNRQAFTIPELDRPRVAEEIKIDCIHCRALRAGNASPRSQLAMEADRAEKNPDRR